MSTLTVETLDPDDNERFRLDISLRPWSNPDQPHHGELYVSVYTPEPIPDDPVADEAEEEWDYVASFSSVSQAELERKVKSYIRSRALQAHEERVIAQILIETLDTLS